MSLLNKIFLFSFLPFIALPQIIQSFEVSGNKNFSKSQILSFSEVNNGYKYYKGIEDSIKIRLSRNFAALGYFNSTFELKKDLTDDSSKVNLFLKIKEGDPTYLKNIVFDNAGSIDTTNILPSFSFLEGQIFNKFKIEDNINEALRFYENNGYPFAKVIISSVHVYYDSVKEESLCDIIFRIEKSVLNRIDKIQISGNTKTKDNVIIREIRLRTGGYYSQQKIEELPGRLNRLRFFDPVPVPAFYINSKNEGVLLITVKEKETNNFDGILGYVPGTRVGEKGYLTGLVNVNLRNLFGTGRTASIRWQQANRLTQEMELRYLEPWILGFPFNISGTFFQRKQDTSYVQRKYEGSLEFLAAEDLSALFSIAAENVIPTFDTLNRFTVFNSSAFTTGVSLKYDNRDDPYAPTTGLLFSTGYSFSRKKIYGPEQFITSTTNTNLNFQRISLDFNIFHEIFRRHIAALGVHGRELKGSSFEESDLFRLGGTSSLRGYRENQFLGNRILWTNLEYRFLLARRSYAFIFYDTGYYLRDADVTKGVLKLEEFKMGYGFGLSIETGLGVLGVSFALAKGDSFSDGKIHFGIVNEF